MSIAYNPGVVKSGAAVCLDARNTKSYSGSGNTLVNITGSGNMSGTTVVTTEEAAIDLNLSSSLELTLTNPIDKNSWSLILWCKSTGITQGNYRQVIRLSDPAGRAAGISYFYLIDTRETTNCRLLGYQRDFFINSWLSYQFADSASWLTEDWYCIGISHNNKVFKHYVNGQLVNTQTQTRDVDEYSDIDKLSINGSSQNAVNIGHVLLYDRILNDSEFTQNFNALRGRYGI